jgi:hypothetical protein
MLRSGADVPKHVGGEILDERRGRSLTGKFKREEEIV